MAAHNERAAPSVSNYKKTTKQELFGKNGQTDHPLTV